MNKYILDANIFFNMEAGFNLGKNTKDVVINLTKIIRDLKTKRLAEFFMPPRIIDEFLGFFEDKEDPILKDFLSLVTIKSPDVGKINISANIFYQLIDDIRTRSYRGLNLGEEEIEKVAADMMGQQKFDKKDFQIKVGTYIKNYRERYRKATRFGFLDSLADLDLIVLAKEQDATIVTSDEGVFRWARTFGVKEILAGVWQKQLEGLMSSVHRQE